MSKADDLKSHVPEAISQLKEFTELYNTQGIELDNIYAALEDIVKQCFVKTATWGLEYWERMLGIPVDPIKATNYRRDVILSKIKGTGTVTATLIDTIAESYDNGEVQIIEHPEVYSFDVKFVGTRGIPPNLEDLKQAIENVKPAHLKATYIYTYTTWGEIKATTWINLKTSTWGQLKTRMVI